MSVTVKLCPVPPARIATTMKFPAVFTEGNASVDVVAVPASRPACWISAIVAGPPPAGAIAVGSDAVSLSVFVSPPPDTVTALVTELGADADTLTVSVIGG